ncbi:MAG TPA: DUF3313 domain-containing protein, partial [Myxococcota bacterium]|nr:DUF3313 domain-containing protein [Myxococcota bacterium]
MTATRIGVVLGALALASWFTACTTTQAAKPELPGGKCAYLAPSVCSKLVAGDDVALRYRAPNVDWKKYSKVFVSPVLGYGGEDRKIPAQDSQFLANYMHQAFVQQFAAKGFQVVEDPGPGVIKVQAAMVDPEAAVPILRTVSMVVPQVRALATLKLLATDSYPFVGGIGGELEATDSQTGELLAAGVDRRIGGGNITTAAQWKWGDAENVMDHWA